MISIFDTTHPSRCDDLSHPNVKIFALSLFIVLGILVSYLPQHIRIISRRSSEGLSPWFVLLGTTSSTFALFNIICLPITQTDIGCCRVNGRFACFAGLLGVAQVFVQWGCFAMMYVFCATANSPCLCNLNANEWLQNVSLPDFLPSTGSGATSCRRSPSSHMAHCAGSRANLRPTLFCPFNRLCNHAAMVSHASPILGHGTGNLRCSTRMCTVPTPALDDMEAAKCNELKHPDDVYTDAWIVCVCRIIGSTVGCGGLEFMGNVRCYGMPAGDIVGYGNLV
jgi:hypothetical protein